MAVTTTTRDMHGYRKTRGFSKMGSAGTGTVVDFGTPRHTTYPYHGIAGMYGYITLGEHHFYFYFFTFFSHFSHFFSIVSHRDTTKHGSVSRAYIFHFHHHTSEYSKVSTYKTVHCIVFSGVVNPPCKWKTRKVSK